jgi:hypothetical protein
VKAAVDGEFRVGTGGVHAPGGIGGPGRIRRKEYRCLGRIIGRVTIADAPPLHRIGKIGRSHSAHRDPAARTIRLTQQQHPGIIDAETRVWFHIGHVAFQSPAENHPVAIRGNGRRHRRRCHRTRKDPLSRIRRIVAQRPASQIDRRRPVIVQLDPPRAVPIHIKECIRIIRTPRIVFHEFIDPYRPSARKHQRYYRQHHHQRRRSRSHRQSAGESPGADWLLKGYRERGGGVQCFCRL